MRKVFLLLTTALVAFGLAGSSSAALLNWEGSSVLLLGDFPQGTFSGGGVATVNGSAGGVPAHLNSLGLAASRGQIGGDLTLLVTDPETVGNGIAAIQFVGIEGGTGVLSPISGAAASTATLGSGSNVLPVRGVVKLCLVSTTCTSFLPLVLTEGSGTKGVGIGGLLTIGGTSVIRISVEAAPWTIKTATVVDHITTTGGNTAFVNITLPAFAHGPASGTTSTAQPSGVVQMVTPAQARTNLALGSNAKVSAAMTAVIHFIPEPGLLLLIGSGVVGLAVLGRNRMRK